MKPFHSLKFLFLIAFWLMAGAKVYGQILEPVFNSSMTPITFGPSESALGEGINNVIDGNKLNKFLTFEKSWGLNFYVNTGAISIVKSLTITTANDHPERDPKLVQIYGRLVSEGATTTDTNPSWTLIDEVSFSCTTLGKNRGADNSKNISNGNDLAFNSYWIRLHNPCDASAANSVQIAEVQMEGIFNQAPAITFDPMATGGAEVGKEITVAYDYSDPEGDVESGTTFQWYLGGVAIAGATNASYTPTINDLGSLLKVKVTPNDGTSFGESIFPVLGTVSCASGFTCEIQNVSICDSDTYQVPGGALVSSNGTYEVTEGTVKTYYNVTFDRTDIVSDVYVNATMAESGSVTYQANTNATGVLTFDKSQDYWVNLNALQDELNGTNRSVFMWVKSEANVATDKQVLFAINTSSGGNVTIFWIDNVGDNLEIFDSQDNQSASFDMSDQLWHYVGYTYNATTHETVIYVDGIENDRFTDNQLTASNSQYSLGQEFDNANDTDHFNGDMAEISVWNEVLTGAEIREAMQSKINDSHPKYANLVGYYSIFGDCDDATDVLKDHSGKDNDGVMENNFSVDFKNVQSIPGFNAIDWYENISWKKDGIEVSIDPTYTFNVATGNYEFVTTRNFIQSINTWTLTANNNSTTVNNVDDETVCSDDAITKTVSTSAVNYLDFEKDQDDYIDVSELTNDLVGTDRSVFMWVNKESNVPSGDNYNLFSIHADNGTESVTNFYIRDNEKLAIFDGANVRDAGSTLANDMWNFVGYTYNATTFETKVYLNGTVINTFTEAMPITLGNTAYLGMELDDNGPSDFLDGKLAEITVWNKLLLEEEVTSLMSAAPVHNASNLIAFYGAMKNIADHRLFDLTDNLNDGIATSRSILVSNAEAEISGYNALNNSTFSWKKEGTEFDTDATGNITIDEGTTNYSVTYGTPLFQKTDEFALSFTNLIPTQPIAQSGLELGSVTFEVDQVPGASYQWYQRGDFVERDDSFEQVKRIFTHGNVLIYVTFEGISLSLDQGGNFSFYDIPNVQDILFIDNLVYLATESSGIFVSELNPINFTQLKELNGLASLFTRSVYTNSEGDIIVIHGKRPGFGGQFTDISIKYKNETDFEYISINNKSYISIKIDDKIYVTDDGIIDEYIPANNNVEEKSNLPIDIKDGEIMQPRVLKYNGTYVVGYSVAGTFFITTDFLDADQYQQFTIPQSGKFIDTPVDIYISNNNCYVAFEDGLYTMNLSDINAGFIKDERFGNDLKSVGGFEDRIYTGSNEDIQFMTDIKLLDFSSTTTHQLTISNLSLEQDQTQYFVEVAKDGCFKTSNAVLLRVADIPRITSVSPANGSTDIALDSELEIVFNAQIVKGEGSIYLKNAFNNNVLQAFDVADDEVVVSGNSITLSPNLEKSIKYYVELEPGVVENVEGNGNAELLGAGLFEFSSVCEDLILDQPVDQTAGINGSASFSVPLVEGATYQWHRYLETLFTTKTTEHGLGDNSVFDIFESNGVLYVATQAGLSISSDGGLSFENKTNDNSGLSSNATKSVKESEGVLYVGTTSGLSVSMDGGDTFTAKGPYPETGTGLSVQGLFIKNGIVYILTGLGLHISVDKGDSFELRTKDNSGLPSNNVASVFVTDEALYVLTKRDGLSISTDGGQSFVTKTIGDGTSTSYEVLMRDNVIYVGTSKGLAISDDNGDTFRILTTTDGLINNNVKRVFESDGVIYLGTDHGISATSNEGLTFTNYGAEDGLPSATAQAVYEFDGLIYYGTQSGLSISDVSQLNDNSDNTAVNQITGATTNELTFNNLNQDVNGIKYYVVVDKGICTESSNVGVLTIVEAPGIESVSPITASTDVSIDVPIAITFNRDITKGTGSIRIIDYTTDVEKQAFSPDDVTIVGRVVTLPTTNLGYGTKYYITVDADAVLDNISLGNLAVTDKEKYTFSTICEPLVLEQPTDETGYIGRSVTFSVPEVAGATYGWFKKGEDSFSSNNLGQPFAIIIANSVFVEGESIYVGNNTGLSISKNAGANWTTVIINQNGSANSISVLSVYAVGNNIYVGTGSGVFISTDGGTNWTNTTNGQNGFALANGVRHIYAVGNTVYAGTNGGGLSISEDGGTNWVTTINGQNGFASSDIVNSVYAVGNTVYAGTIGGLSISTDGGASWSTTTSGQNGFANTDKILSIHVDGNNLYAGTNDGGLSISTDGGANWVTTTNGQNGFASSNSVNSVHTVGNTVYAGTNGGLSISTDGGASWTTTTRGQNGFPDINRVYSVYATEGKVYVGTAIGFTILSVSTKQTDNADNTASNQITGANTHELTINNLTLDLDQSEFFVVVSKGNCRETSDLATLTVTEQGPVVTALSPEKDEEGVAIDATLNITFDQAIAKGTGDIEIRRASDDEVLLAIAANLSLVSVDGDKASIGLGDTNFEFDTKYYVNIPNTAFKSTEGVAFAGINDKTTWSFTTEAPSGLGISSLTPSNGATDVLLSAVNSVSPNDNRFWITFNEGVKYGNTSAEYRLYKADNDELVASQT
ncbi:MAG: hypothetical protein COW40_01480, partial [Cytophagales bacterium CG17_big_fil_post_rev_8_21_14_2_50_40_13]